MTGPFGMGVLRPNMSIEYDGVVDAIWYSKLDLLETGIDWPTLFDAILYDIRLEESALPGWSGGLYSFDAWYDESGEAPATYDYFLLTTESPMWLLQPQDATTDPYTNWPTLAEALSHDLWLDSGTWEYSGPIYFDTWMIESGEAPTSYQDVIDAIGSFWYSKLDDLV